MPDFALFLPLGAREATHVVDLSGEERDFRHALATAMDSGVPQLQPLLLPVGATPLGKLADILNSIGEASVQSIDPIPANGVMISTRADRAATEGQGALPPERRGAGRRATRFNSAPSHRSPVPS
jgi:hypothetical protein